MLCLFCVCDRDLCVVVLEGLCVCAWQFELCT